MKDFRLRAGLRTFFSCAQNQARREMLFDGSVIQARLLPQLLQFIWRETLQDRKRAVFPYQAIMQKQMSEGGVKKISHWVAVQIYDEDPTPGDATHFAEEVHCTLVIKVMQR